MEKATDQHEPKNFWTIDPTEPVKIRFSAEGPAAESAISVPEYFLKIADEYHHRPALTYQDENSQWKTVNYG